MCARSKRAERADKRVEMTVGMLYSPPPVASLPLSHRHSQEKLIVVMGDFCLILAICATTHLYCRRRKNLQITSF